MAATLETVVLTLGSVVGAAVIDNTAATKRSVIVRSFIVTLRGNSQQSDRVIHYKSQKAFEKPFETI